MSEVTDLIRTHHRDIASRLSSAADAVQEDGGVGPLLAFLRDDLLPHARGEERHLYAAIDALAKGALQISATMRIDHAHIERYAGAIEATAARMPRDAADAAALAAALRVLVTRLQALVEVHLEKEERVYLPFLERTMPIEDQRALLADIHEAAGSASGEVELDVRPLPHQARHQRIFATFESLDDGGSFVLVVDHDPKPLHRHFELTYPERFAWEYLSEGPEWRIRVRRVSREAGVRVEA